MTIYEIDREIEELLDGAVDEETGELKENVAELLNALAMERDRKRENIACWIVNLRSDVDALRAQEQILATRRRSEEKRLERAKAYLEEISCGEALKTDRVSVSFRSSSHVEFKNESDFIEWAEENFGSLLRTKDPEIDRKAVTAALKAGKEIPGAALVSGLSMMIR